MKGRGVAIGAVVAGGLVIAFVLAFFVSPWASSQPDGLNRVAIDQGFAEHESDHFLSDGPLAGYETKGVSNERLTTGVAGVIGVTVTFLIGLGLFVGMKALQRGAGEPELQPATATAAGGTAGP